MGDLHGANRALTQCLERSGFDLRKDVLIQLGDVVDGHEEVFECVETLLTIPRLIAIRGNHDQWFRIFFETGHHPVGWKRGAGATARSYMGRVDKKLLIHRATSGYKPWLNPGDIPRQHQNFFRRQRLFYLDDAGRCFVHGGFGRDMRLERQRSVVFYSDRGLWTDATRFEGAHLPMKESFESVFIGHTSTTNRKTDQPIYAAGIWNLDTGAGNIGRLTIMDVETKEFWQSDPVGELYP